MAISQQQYRQARISALVQPRGSNKVTMTSTLRDRSPAPQPKEIPEGQVTWGGISSFTAGENKQRAPIERTTPTVHYHFDDVFGDSSIGFEIATTTPLGPDERITTDEIELAKINDQNVVDPADFDAVYIDPGPDGIVGTPDDLLIDPGPTEETRELLKSVGQVDIWVEVWRREKKVRIDDPSGSGAYVEFMKCVSMVFKTPEPAPDGGQRFVKFNFQKTEDTP